MKVTLVEFAELMAGFKLHPYQIEFLKMFDKNLFTKVKTLVPASLPDIKQPSGERYVDLSFVDVADEKGSMYTFVNIHIYEHETIAMTAFDLATKFGLKLNLITGNFYYA